MGLVDAPASSDTIAVVDADATVLDADATAVDADTFRHALGHFVTGVTVATTCGGAGEPVGMTAWFAEARRPWLVLDTRRVNDVRRQRVPPGRPWASLQG